MMEVYMFKSKNSLLMLLALFGLVSSVQSMKRCSAFKSSSKTYAKKMHFSAHVKMRMQERGIVPSEIRRAVNADNKVLTTNHHIKYKMKNLCVITSLNSSNIITAYREHGALSKKQREVTRRAERDAKFHKRQLWD